MNKLRYLIAAAVLLCTSLIAAQAPASAGAKLDIRNVDIQLDYVEYDLYFVFDPSYVIQEGKTLGVRIHEYGNIYSFSSVPFNSETKTTSAGYGDGGSSVAYYFDSSDLDGKSEIAVARVRWTLSSNSVVKTKDEWSDVLVKLGNGEYATIALGFDQELTYSARDITLSNQAVNPYEGIITVDGALVALEYFPTPYSTNVKVDQIFTITFSEDIRLGSTQIRLRYLGGDIIETFEPISEKLSIKNEVLTIDPSSPLSEASAYRIELLPGSITTSDAKLYSGDHYDFYTAGFDPSAGAKLDIRNVDIQLDYVEYDLYFVFDPSYVIQEGKTLGVRIHEYGNIYSFSSVPFNPETKTTSAGYGNGGSSVAYYFDSSDLDGKSEIAVARVRWTLSSNSVVKTKDEWSDVLVKLGNGEYATIALGFDQELTYSARDITLSNQAVNPYEGIITVDGALVALEYFPTPYSTNVKVDQIFTITFSEDIRLGSTQIRLRYLGGDIIETFEPISEKLSIKNEVLTIDPSSPLSEASAYRIELLPGSITTSDAKLYSGDHYDFYTAGFDPSAGAKLDIRNVDIQLDYVEYDLYFVFDPSYVIQEGKTLGVRIHEYGNIYSFSSVPFNPETKTTSAGYGNGGSSVAYYFDSSDLDGKSEIAVARVRWTLSSDAVVKTKDEWSDVLVKLGNGEYATIALGFDQELTYSARDITLSNQAVTTYTGGVLVDTDGDGIGNNTDTDDDGDGVPDSDDAFPLDANESLDTDGDGIGNNADTDDDGDGYLDQHELEMGSDPLDSDDMPRSGGLSPALLRVISQGVIKDDGGG